MGTMTSQGIRDGRPEASLGWATRVRREIKGIGYAWADPATRRGTLATTLVLAGTFGYGMLPPDNVWRGVPGIGWMQTSAPGRILSVVLLLYGVILLLDAWLRIRPAESRRPISRGTVWWWSLPLLPAPPLLSFDAYSYAAQGEMVHRGFDPYSDGPAVLGDLFHAQVDPIWQFTPAPYGPLSLQVQHLISDLSGHNAYLAAILMRIPAFIGVLLIAIYLPRIAQFLGYDRDQTLWLAVLNPLVVLHLVGGAHNDSLMIGLMVLGLWFGIRHHIVVGSLCIAAAASIKQPAAAAILAVAALHAWRGNDWGRPTKVEVLRKLVPAGLVFAVGFVGIGLASGLGFGWITALGVPGAVRSMLAPFTALGAGLEWLATMAGWSGIAASMVGWTQRVGQLLGVAIMGWLVWKYKAKHPVRTLGWILLAFVITGPVIHPWYLLWGGLLFAMTESSPMRRQVVRWATVGFVLYSAFDFGWFKNSLAAAAVSLVLALAWIATGHDKGLNRDVDLRLPRPWIRRTKV